MKVIGIGETVLDIVFDDNDQPLSAKPGGSVYNALISIARSGHNATFLSEVGDDRVGQIIRRFLTDNGVDDSAVCVYQGSRSPLALAFLDECKNARYQFYKDYPAQRIELKLPEVEVGDIALVASYFPLNPAIRQQVLPALRAAREGGAMLYYDFNFRASHRAEAPELMPAIRENMELAHIVKGSDEDILNMFGESDWRRAYEQCIAPHCPIFICTQGSAGATLLTPWGERHVEAKPIAPVSTIGAGDNFNAGTICGLLDAKVTAADMTGPEIIDVLASAMSRGVEFATEVCLSLENYIAKR